MLFLYFLSLIVIAIAWYQIKYYKRNRLLAKIPSMPSYPLIGSSLSFVGKSAEDIFKNLERSSQEHGSLFKFDLSPFKTNIVSHDPKIIEVILSSQKLLDKSDEYDFVKQWLGDGLLLATGKKWHKRRKIITPTFHFKILEQFAEVMDRQGQIFISNLKKTEGQHLDFFPLISLYALDVICESAMGCKINAQIDASSEYVKAVKEITNISFIRMFDIMKRLDFPYRFTDMYQREQKLLHILHTFTHSVIAARKQEHSVEDQKIVDTEENEMGIKKKTAFLDLLLKSTIDGEPLTNEDIREEVDTFMFAGHDTTTSGMSFVLYNLAMYPEIQQKVFEEARAVFGDDREKMTTMSELNQLNYLELVIKESFRLFPPVPFIGRNIFEETRFGDVVIPENTSVIIAPIFLGRDPNIYPDPLKFDPLRFNVDTNNEKNNPFSYVPFSAGPRNCVGQKFAMLEMKSLVSKVVRSFEVSIAKENEKLQLISEIVLRPTNGIVLCVKQRVY